MLKCFCILGKTDLDENQNCIVIKPLKEGLNGDHKDGEDDASGDMSTDTAEGDAIESDDDVDTEGPPPKKMCRIEVKRSNQNRTTYKSLSRGENKVERNKSSIGSAAKVNVANYSVSVKSHLPKCTGKYFPQIITILGSYTH